MEDDVHQYLGPGPVNCTANDIRIAFARVTAINGQEYNSNDPILCDPGTTMQVNMTAFLEASSEKERGDVGIWIGNPGGDAKTGDTCNHYNLIPGSDGTVNGDGDACAGMKAPAKDQPDTTAVDLGPITVSCPTSGPIQVGGCVAWTVPGQDPSDPNDDLSQCPDNHDGTLPSGESTDFRASTVPGTPAKCNCDGFSVPVILAGKITIVKDAVPDHAQDFAYTATGNGMSGFTLDDDPASLTPTNTKVFSSLVPLAAGGSRTVTETPLPGGWVITNIVCTNTTGSTVQIGGDSDFDAGDNSVTVANLASAADITCTFTNTKQGSIKIVKDAQPNHEQDFSYTASGTGMTPSPFSLDDDADGTLSNEQLFSNLAPGGVRRVTEDTETGWTLTNIACTGNSASTVVIGAAGGFNAGDTFVDITLANGEDIVCTFTNTKQGSIKIVKDAVPDDAQDFSYTASGTGMTPSPFSLDDDADGTLSNEQLFSGLLPNGVRRVTEDTETGWTLTNIACTGNTNSTVVIGAAGGFNAGDTFVDVTIADGENIVCTFTNSKLGSIKIVKDAQPNHEQDFSYTASGTGMTPSPFSLDDDANGTLSNEQLFSGLLANGTARRVTEDTETGWTLTNIACTGNTASTVVIGAAGGFNAGDTFVDVTIVNGENIVCTFTNTKQGSIKIVKDAVPNDAQDFSYTASGTGMTPSPFDLDDDADGTLSNEQLFSGLLPNGVRRVTEDTETGWTLTNIACTGNTNSTVVIGAAGGFNAGDTFVDVTIADGENIVCTFTNTKHGSIKIVKDTKNPETDAKDFAYSASGTGMTPSPFSLDDDADGTLSNEQLFSALLPNGTRTVSETVDPEWALTNIVCTGNTLSTVVIGAAGGFNAGDNSVNIGLSAGENIVCTFTNQHKARLTVEKQITVAGRSETFTISCTPGAPLTACGDLDPDFSLGDGGSKSSGFLLLPGTYTVCEADIPVNWSATATLNGGAVGLTNPDLPEDLGKRCVDVTVAYNEDKTLRFINDPPPEGDARTPGYWKNWSSCTGGKQWEKANALGPEGISKTLDGNLPIDLVGDFGTYNVTTCLQAFKILSMQDQSGKNQGGDGAYILARALLAAELNVKALVTPCSEAADAIEDGQILLGSTGGTLSDGTVVSAGDAANFTGSGTYWKGGKNAAALRAKALAVAGILDSFNNNLLCGP